ncbi:MAG: RidA family protein [Alphaproteobacteria bacterium]|nr:RidA family protein [Alphaproteobacteria bacterium]
MRAILLLSLLVSGAAGAQAVRHVGPAEAPIAAAVDVPAGARTVYLSGNVPDVADPAAPAGSVARYGDTAAQTRSILAKIEKQLAGLGLGMGDVVMMRVYLVAPPGQARMDFAGMMKAYSEKFGTAAQPARPARATMQVAGLVDPGWLVEIEVTAARKQEK